MKKTIFLSMLLILTATQSFADTTPPAAEVTPDTSNNQTTPVQQPTDTQTATPQAEPIINCTYKIPENTKTIDQALVLKWSEKAVIQSFSFNPQTLDAQLKDLQNCFTEQGWISFNSALEKSGNIDAIKTQSLTVSSMVDGDAQVLEAKDNEWKISFPMHVVYQNDKEKVTQLLSITLTVGRKIDGDLGINQIIASPRTNQTTPTSDSSTSTTPETQSSTPNTTNTTTTPSPSTDSTAPTQSDTTPAQQQDTGTSTSQTPGSSN